MHHPGAVAGDEVTRPLGVGRKLGEEGPPGQVLPERLDDLLVVALPGSTGRIPHDDGVGGSRVLRRGLRADDDGADHDRHSDVARGDIDLRSGVGIGQRVDIGGVLRPDHELGLGALPARTSSASFSVWRTWLSRTARRWLLKSSPSLGTLP